MGTNLTVILIAAILPTVLLVLVLVVLLTRTRRPPDKQGSLTLVQQQLDALRQQTTETLSNNARTANQQLADLTTQLNRRLEALDKSMQSTTGLIGDRLDSATRVVKDVSASLGELSQATKQVFDVGKDIASLQDILRAPKLRGIIGELFLGNLLKQVVPNNYELQHRFRSGEAVDAVVKMAERLVPIDAKFPLEDFQRLTSETDDEKRKPLRRKFLAAVRKHIDAVARKYILPDEGTFDFALMYIPAENVYYETIIKNNPDDDSLTDYAISQKVIPVSPNSLYAYLQAIVLGLRGFQIEKRAGEILKYLGRLQQEFNRFREEFEVLGTHVTRASNKYDDVARRLSKLEGKLAIGSDLEDPEREKLPRRQE
ncbi:hypothetical protein CH330_06860 [candidate division WOR-3 bacterium JGI_Cruoil_03_51_56]|uniref:DNA recombination protein RmuC n=1 Tax=candidate division WOR-3 bacterium JGI_Cruoil_03_51_56 TaxID=1973747 RepID=A0A235BTZ9_UNCW3|nr:MAG: hypothetical protein CH330_06860 [candidate division WOR-3 bacterium JGI_Cruoil_03_51_56]